MTIGKSLSFQPSGYTIHLTSPRAPFVSPASGHKFRINNTWQPLATVILWSSPASLVDAYFASFAPEFKLLKPSIGTPSAFMRSSLCFFVSLIQEHILTDFALISSISFCLKFAFKSLFLRTSQSFLVNFPIAIFSKIFLNSS